MFKFIFGVIVGIFITYNYIIPDPVYKTYLDKSNILLLELVQNIEQEIRKNVDN